MSDAFWFWLMRPLADMAVVIVVVMIFCAIAGLLNLPSAIRAWRCKWRERNKSA